MPKALWVIGIGILRVEVKIVSDHRDITNIIGSVALILFVICSLGYGAYTIWGAVNDEINTTPFNEIDYNRIP